MLAIEADSMPVTTNPPPQRRYAMTIPAFRIEHEYLTLPPAFYTRTQPTPLTRNPRLVMFNAALAQEMGFHASDPSEWTGVGAGQELLEGMDPVAMKYTGHQFGAYNPDLGDGRGLLLWETIGPDGKRWDWHLKGAGHTPYSRFGDGRAVLRSTIREYLCSEAMHYLGIPSTRALFMVKSDDPVAREEMETAATLMRVSPTHIRFGHFEYAAYHQGAEALHKLIRLTVRLHFPNLLNLPEPEQYAAFFTEVCRRTARMIVHWQTVGFCHGVMNSDNMSIIGETFDYGPYAFLDDFDAGYICNHTDQQGRYAYNRQPEIGFINLQMLARALTTVMKEDDVRRALRAYESEYNERFTATMRAKLGLETSQDGDMDFIIGVFKLLQADGVDYTRFFRGLSTLESKGPEPVRDLFIDRQKADDWLEQYRQRLEHETTSAEDREQAMCRVNPKYILRNYLAQQAIDAATEDNFKPLETLLEVLKKPYDEQPEHDTYASLPPDWGKAMSISCSS